jgi:ribonuclease Z
MVRALGSETAMQQAAALRCVWVSHRHADHCMGLAGLLAARPPTAPALLVVGPLELQTWLAELHASHGFRTIFIHCR